MKIKEVFEQYISGAKSDYYIIDNNTSMCVMYINCTNAINENTVVVPATTVGVKIYISRQGEIYQDIDRFRLQKIGKLTGCKTPINTYRSKHFYQNKI